MNGSAGGEPLSLATREKSSRCVAPRRNQVARGVSLECDPGTFRGGRQGKDALIYAGWETDPGS
jgi:hypothetical protein